MKMMGLRGLYKESVDFVLVSITALLIISPNHPTRLPDSIHNTTMFFIMPRLLVSLLALGALSLNGVLAEGINCNGSSDCEVQPEGIMGRMVSAMSAIDDNAWYDNGQKIACTFSPDNGICAFLQGTGGAPGHSIKTLIGELQGHGCKTCGSIPLFYPQDNNVADGMLTVNYVTGVCSKARSSNTGRILNADVTLC